MRGFGKPDRRTQVKEYMRGENLDGIGLLETIRESFTQKELDDLAGGSSFRWIWKSAMGHYGGILVGIKDETCELEDSEIVDYFISMVLRSRLSNVRWELITVYGPAQHSSSSYFISELSQKCIRATLPLLLGGDFNLIRFIEDKNNSNLDQALMDKFNMFIDLFQLQEIRRSGVKFTWTSKQINPVMVNLDRILVTIE
jgi:hypothetical protein